MRPDCLPDCAAAQIPAMLGAASHPGIGWHANLLLQLLRVRGHLQLLRGYCLPWPHAAAPPHVCLEAVALREKVALHAAAQQLHPLPLPHVQRDSAPLHSPGLLCRAAQLGLPTLVRHYSVAGALVCAGQAPQEREQPQWRLLALHQRLDGPVLPADNSMYILSVRQSLASNATLLCLGNKMTNPSAGNDVAPQLHGSKERRAM